MVNHPNRSRKNFTQDELRNIYNLVQSHIGALLDEVERCNSQERKDDATYFYARVEEAKALSRKVVSMIEA